MLRDGRFTKQGIMMRFKWVLGLEPKQWEELRKAPYMPGEVYVKKFEEKKGKRNG